LDFTVNAYINLLGALRQAGYNFLTFRVYMQIKSGIKEPGNRKPVSKIFNPQDKVRSTEQGNYNQQHGEWNRTSSIIDPGHEIREKENKSAIPGTGLSDINQNNKRGAVRDTNLLPPPQKFVILRHDIDALPENSLRFAQIQAEMGITGSFYFRIVPKSYNEAIIREIAKMGHEIGYHYENMDFCHGNLNSAYKDFCSNMEKIRTVVPVETICMHGSPRSGYDNRELWQKYNYRSLGIIGEPYFDIDFNSVAYFTDTGRRWNGQKYSIRDKVKSNWHFDFRTTKQIIDNINQLPHGIMFTFHPQRWTNNKVLWMKELVFQNTKNIVKRFLYA
jgi:hypothetical protein